MSRTLSNDHLMVVENLRQRLKTASENDRKYERPMNWAEAEMLLTVIDHFRPPRTKAGDVRSKDEEADDALQAHIYNKSL